MTFLDKALELEYANNSTEVSVYEIMKNYCPSEYGLSEDTKCEEKGESTERDCVKCWNRETPKTESKDEPSCDDVKAAYEQGLNEAWELAKKMVAPAYIGGMGENECIAVFGMNLNGYEVLSQYTPQEALAKLKAYEEAQNKIKIGDVVLLSTCPFIKYVVLTAYDNEVSMYSLIPKGTYPLQRISKDHFDMIEKTGEHINLAQILSQILSQIGGE